jgi:hypothetical protein
VAIALELRDEGSRAVRFLVNDEQSRQEFVTYRSVVSAA